MRDEVHDEKCGSSYTHRVIVCYEAKIVEGTLRINEESNAFALFTDLPENTVFDFSVYLQDEESYQNEYVSQT